MEECGIEAMRAAAVVNSFGILIIAVLLGFMFYYVKQLVEQQSVDNSLQNELSKTIEDNELKDKMIKNLNDQNSILMGQNANISDQRNEFAILLNQEINKSK